eukprot:COSAG05_NODE_15748_length_362_cov_0.908745_1_plen_69_part_01
MGEDQQSHGTRRECLSSQPLCPQTPCRSNLAVLAVLAVLAGWLVVLAVLTGRTHVGFRWCRGGCVVRTA